MENRIELRHKLHYLYVVLDFILTFVFTSFVFFVALWTKNFDVDVNLVISAFSFSGAMSIIMVFSFYVFGIYRMMIRHFGMPEAIKIFAIVFANEIIGLIVFIIVRSFTNFIDGVSIFSWALCGLLLCFLLPTTRLYARLKNFLFLFFGKTKSVNTLVIGAGASAKVVVDECNRNKKMPNNILVFVDDDPSKIGGTFANRPIEGPISNVASIIEKYRISEVIIAISNLTKENIKTILSYLRNCPVRIKRLPILSELDGPQNKKIIDIDIDELLGRDNIVFANSELTESIKNKTILVTGAGGSIGSELSRQIFAANPSTLILFDIYENTTYEIEQELKTIIRQTNNTSTKLVTLIGSTYDEKTVERIFKKYHPDYVYHAAAYKHVPLMESSPIEAIRTNVIGTYNVAKIANQYKTKKMVLISTDKAVRPTNVMGATKRFAETIIQYFSSISKDTAYAAVRFGNVLGSNGSVVPLFKKQIEQGGPVTITSKEIIRYFMTIPEAVSLVLQCGLFAKGGEIFILDMGEPVKVLDLAKKMIRQAGFVPDKDIKIIETGLRPGEKMFEELLLDKTRQQKTANKKIFIEEKTEIKPIEDEIIEISKVFKFEDLDEVKKLLGEVVEDYKIEQ